MTRKLSRRQWLKIAAMASAAALLAACQPKVVEKIVKETVVVEKVVKEVVKETIIVVGTPQVVEKEVTKIVKEEVEVERVITATAARTAAATPTAEPTVSATPTPAATPTAIQKGRVITLEAEDLSLGFSQELYWNGEGFAREYDAYRADKGRYVEGIVEGFSEEFLKLSNLQATGWRVSFISEYELETGKATYLTLIRCKIDGAASGTVERPYFRSEWLLRSLLEKGVDLYDFEYTPDKTTLAYEGETDHTSIAIILRFSKPVGHCHYHIWYEAREGE